MNKFTKYFILVSLFISGQTIAQENSFENVKSLEITLHFRFDRYDLEKDYLDNTRELYRLDSLLKCNSVLDGLDSLHIGAYSSPEGNPVYNNVLASKRAQTIKQYLQETYPSIYNLNIISSSKGENWDGLRQMVLLDSKVPFREQVLELIDSPLTLVEKERKLRALQSGESWRYITRHIFPHLRGSSFIVLWIDRSKTTSQLEPEMKQTVEPEIKDTLSLDEPLTYSPPEYVEQPSYRYVRPLALKTNLLFDAATILNVEIEVPIARRWSIAGEWIFPWWLWENKQNCLEVLQGTLEARYWFKNDFSKQEVSLQKHNPLAGWFVGLYGGAGYYDLEWHRKGYQGEFFVAVGLSAGYVRPLNRSLSMEFSLGIGFLKTDYRYYNAKQDVMGDWRLIKQYPGSFTWIGPTKAKISLIWYPHFKKNLKGGKK